MVDIALEHVAKHFGKSVAVDDLDLYVPDKELLVIVGPSGCGKTTTLRMIAGLETVTAGRILLGGRCANGWAPRHRHVAMVFQNGALYPQWNVYHNLAFGLRLQRVAKAEIDRRVRQAADRLGIAPLLFRRPGQLSGGECQRVAIGRAVVKEPDAFLFDEPLSHLDAPLRATLRRELVRLQRQLQTTMVYVTHDQVEALSLGDRVAVMHAGRIQQIGAPADVYQRPANRFVAEFLGSPPMNFLDGVLAARDSALQVAFEDFQVALGDGPEERCAGRLGQRVTLGIRPQAIAAVPYAGGGGPGPVTATVVLVQSLGAETYLDVRRGRQELTVRAAAGQPLQPGDAVQLTFDSRQCHLFDPATGRAVAR